MKSCEVSAAAPAGSLNGGAEAEQRVGHERPARPRLLFLCQTLPFPPDSGVHIRSFNVLRLLAHEFDVTALCFVRRTTRPTAAHVKTALSALSEITKVEAFPIASELSRARWLSDHVRSVGTCQPYTRFVYDSAEFRARLKGLLAERRVDLVHLDSLDLSVYLPLFEGIPVVCTHHNIESQLLRRRAAAERSPGRRAYMALQARLMEAEERRWCGRVDLNIVVSPDDAKELARIAPGARVVIVPNGVDTSTLAPGPTVRDTVLFVGGETWFPNRDAMDYYCRDVLPLIRARRPGTRSVWVGRASRWAERLASQHGIEVTGYVPDVRPYLRSATCYIAPLRIGGGTRLKILDAWASGKAVVSTSIGCEGLDARDDENILIRDTPAEFAEGVLRVLDDGALRERLGRAARSTAERVYDWHVIGESMLPHYTRLLGHPHQTRT